MVTETERKPIRFSAPLAVSKDAKSVPSSILEEFEFVRLDESDHDRLMKMAMEEYVTGEAHYAAFLSADPEQARALIDYVITKSLHYPYSIAALEKATGEVKEQAISPHSRRVGSDAVVFQRRLTLIGNIGRGPRERVQQRLFEGNALLRRLVRVGVLTEDRMKLDYVLELATHRTLVVGDASLEVFKLGLAKSIHHGRVLIRQKHIRVRRQVVNVPSFVVRLDSQEHIDFSLKSPFGGGRAGRVKRANAKKGTGGGAADEDDE